ncbi:MAG: hypothetical protein SFV24_19260 [Gemmatimonadales bacterium]|nr:hypothetical protein [Gemmatimonadales bacterium]
MKYFFMFLGALVLILGAGCWWLISVVNSIVEWEEEHGDDFWPRG